MQYNYLIFIMIFLLILLPAIKREKRRRAICCKKDKKKHTKGESHMKELAKQFIGKDCIIYTIMGNDNIVKGLVKEVTDGGVTVECDGNIQAVNLEYVTLIKEWPRNSKGKKKTVFM